MSGCFFDSNVLIYSIDRDDPRSVKACLLLEDGGTISVQCLNEFASVIRRKLGWAWPRITAALDHIMHLCRPVISLDRDLQAFGVAITDRYDLDLYHGMIVAAALTANCDILYSEDLHAGLVIDSRLTIVNPFA